MVERTRYARPNPPFFFLSSFIFLLFLFFLSVQSTLDPWDQKLGWKKRGCADEESVTHGLLNDTIWRPPRLGRIVPDHRKKPEKQAKQIEGCSLSFKSDLSAKDLGNSVETPETTRCSTRKADSVKISQKFIDRSRFEASNRSQKF